MKKRDVGGSSQPDPEAEVRGEIVLTQEEKRAAFNFILGHDTEFQEHRITEVTGDPDNGWTISCDGMCFGVPGNSPIVPEVGRIARFYGRGFGYQVRGLSIESMTGLISVFYRTPDEQAEQNRLELLESERQEREKFEANRERLDVTYQSLPAVFQARIDRFRAGNANFRWKFECYEMFCCTQAIAFAEALKTPDAIKQWRKLGYDEQRAQVPAMEDGHSGNTFGCACMLAFWFLKEPNIVPKLHGGLTPLVGCEEYGCTHPSALPTETPTQQHDPNTKES
jgi:hypothetical protein